MAFRNLMLTTGGMILYAKAQQGKLLHLSRVAVGDGLLSSGDSMVNRSGLKSERASFLIDYVHIAASNSAAEILTTMCNDDLEAGFYFRELGIFAVDPDTGEEQLYLYDNAGTDGEYIPAAAENVQVVERLKMIVRLENTPNVTFTASGNPLYLTVDDIDDHSESPGSLWSSLKISQLIAGMQAGLTGEPGQFVGFDKNGKPEAQTLPESGVGRSMAGKEVQPTQGTTVTASGGAEIFNDYAERQYDAKGLPSSGNIASGSKAHAEGVAATATDTAAHAEGCRTISSGKYSHAEGRDTKAVGMQSHAEGIGTTALANTTHAEGHYTNAKGPTSHAEGQNTTSSGNSAHAEGNTTTASGSSAHAEGGSTIASGSSSHAEGSMTTASGSGSHAEGSLTNAKGTASHAGGHDTIANDYQTVIGAYNVEKPGGITSGSRFIVGGGWVDRKNAFRVDCSGACYGAGAWNTSGADYAELFEWADGNPAAEDRVGRFVTLEGERIRLAGPEDDYILGIVSGNPSVVGGVYDDQWQGMFETDVFGRPVYEDAEIPDELGPDGEVIRPAHMERRQKLNPAYNPAQAYIPRTERPEWDAVGLLGKLVAVDDGTCQVNGWAAVGAGGIAVASCVQTKFRVMARLDETHVRIMIL